MAVKILTRNSNIHGNVRPKSCFPKMTQPLILGCLQTVAKNGFVHVKHLESSTAQKQRKFIKWQTHVNQIIKGYQKN